MSKNQSVIDIKPRNNLVLDIKPKMKEMTIPIEQERFYSVTVNAGQSMGLLLTLTYKEGFTNLSPKAP